MRILLSIATFATFVLAAIFDNQYQLSYWKAAFDPNSTERLVLRLGPSSNERRVRETLKIPLILNLNPETLISAQELCANIDIAWKKAHGDDYWLDFSEVINFTPQMLGAAIYRHKMYTGGVIKMTYTVDEEDEERLKVNFPRTPITPGEYRCLQWELEKLTGTFSRFMQRYRTEINYLETLKQMELIDEVSVADIPESDMSIPELKVGIKKLGEAIGELIKVKARAHLNLSARLISIYDFVGDEEKPLHAGHMIKLPALPVIPLPIEDIRIILDFVAKYEPEFSESEDSP